MRIHGPSPGAINLAIAGALVTIAGTLVFVTLAPQPSLKGIAQAQKAEQDRIFAEVGRTKKSLSESNAKIASWTWKGGSQQVGPAALNAISALAAKNRVRLSGFRPQRPNQSAGLELLPFAATAEGSYPDVLRFVQAIEGSGGKLIVDRIQVSSAEANSDQVTAVLGVTAYRVAEAMR